MTDTPLDLKVGDVVYIDLAHPLRYADGNGGEELRWSCRLQLDALSEVGVSGRGSDIDGLIVPKRGQAAERLGSVPSERPTFFPWSSILRITLLHSFTTYAELWDADELR